MLQLLRSRYAGQLDPRAQEYISHSVEASKRMATMITDLLAYSRAGSKAHEPAPVDLSGVLRHVQTNLNETIRETDALVTSDPLPVVLADVSQMGQLFQNLIGNALKFRSNERRPEVHIGVRTQDGRWLFAVKDNGIGIESEHRERVFLLFQRLHSRSEFPGTGIGLAICKKIVERYGGRIWFESQPGQGTTFFFTLPVE
jgi:light-regulated signal transduction histidine kinase (bacteriophytochrome)